MPFLVDGHNLIPKAALSLGALDDELQLVALLRAYCQRTRKHLEVYFDGAPPAHAGIERFGFVTAHFVTRRSTADAAIKARLKILGRASKNWIVVSSDAAVQAAAGAAGAQVESSEGFARKLLRSSVQDPVLSRDGSGREGGLSEAEISKWLDIFGKQK